MTSENCTQQGTLLCVAIGERYVKQTEVMAASFIRHNPGWRILRAYGLDSVLPEQCRKWTAFDRCEIGRWIILRDFCDPSKGPAGETMLYSDGDVWWLGEASLCGAPVGLSPHYVTLKAARRARKSILRDGRANIGIIEVHRCMEAFDVISALVDEVLRCPDHYRQKGKLWLQPIASAMVGCGCGVEYNRDPGMNVATWNIRREDRFIALEGGREGRRWLVGTEGDGLGYVPLRSLHFSSKSLALWGLFGGPYNELYDEYRNECREQGLGLP